MKRNMHYRTKTLEELFESYVFENYRENQEDAEITKSNIVNEIYARVKDTLELLEEADGPEVHQIYKQFIEF